uniref:DNA topoisomerase n=1 Tax=viral metagenome TaxID=1070528 RepID=A0A6C0DQU5_9ZZZZ
MPPKRQYKKSTVKKEIRVSETAKYLIIVESPSKCSKIESYLGEEYCCIATMGHIRSIEGLKSIDTKNGFKPTFSNIDEKKGHIESIRPIISKFHYKNILIASDDDREGEAIAWHICEVFNLPVDTTPRIIFHEITKPALLKAVREPTTINMKLVQAQHARQVLDIIVGYKISPHLWRYLYNDKTNSLSAGRCQTPALRLVYDNEQEKGVGKGIETKYKTTGHFFSYDIPFLLDFEFKEENQIMDFMEKTVNFNHFLDVGSPASNKKGAPKPFNTSKLLQQANNLLHMSPKETMNHCQTLYQNGFITYMRTDSTKYSAVFLDVVGKYILETWKKTDYLGDKSGLENMDASNPHEAIRVTHIEQSSLPITTDNKRMASLYRLIWKNTVESCMSDYLYKAVPVYITAPNSHKYEYRLEIPTFLGWKVLNQEKKYGIDVENTDDGENMNEIPLKMDPGSLLLYFQSIEMSKQPIIYNKITTAISIQKNHSYYSEASLINKLEKLGIGRPSTFATIVDTIIERGYTKKMDIEGDKMVCSEFTLIKSTIKKEEKEKVFGQEKAKLVIQPVGIITLEFLVKHFEKLFSYDYTKHMEEALDEISSGKTTEWSQLCRGCYNEIKDLSKPISSLEKQLYVLDNTHDFIFERYGPVIRVRADDGTFSYISINKEIKIDLDKLKRGEYTVADLQDITNRCLGKYEDDDLYLKNGKFGPYVQWGENKESIKNIGKPIVSLTLEDVIAFLENKEDNPTLRNRSILRILSPEVSIRTGKFGAYAFYKQNTMPKPQFLSIKKFPDGYMKCDANVLLEWLYKTYNLQQ